MVPYTANPYCATTPPDHCLYTSILSGNVEYIYSNPAQNSASLSDRVSQPCALGWDIGVTIGSKCHDDSWGMQDGPIDDHLVGACQDFPSLLAADDQMQS